MYDTDIPDSDIPGADPAAVVEQYSPFVRKLAKRYEPSLSRTGAIDEEDLFQAGCLAVLKTQQEYNPENGTFLHCLFFSCRSAMRAALGYKNGLPPPALAYLDEPLSEETEDTIGDTVADPDGIPTDEAAIDAATRAETAAEVRAAVDRLKSAKQREVIRRVWLDGQERAAAAEEMGIRTTALYELDREARRRLQHDSKLYGYFRGDFPFFHVGREAFNSTFTSAVEKAILFREQHGFLRQDSAPHEDPF